MFECYSRIFVFPVFVYNVNEGKIQSVFSLIYGSDWYKDNILMNGNFAKETNKLRDDKVNNIPAVFSVHYGYIRS